MASITQRLGILPSASIGKRSGILLSTTFWKRSGIILSTIIIIAAVAFAGCGGAAGSKAGDTEPPAQAPVEAQEPAETQPSDSPDSPGSPGGPDPTAPANPADPANPPSDDSAGPKILIAYFSHTGNTANMADLIHQNTGGELFEIVTVDPYPEDYDTCVAQARQEKANGYRPALASEVTDMGSYDVVFFGYPCWISTMPMACFTFLETYDLSGKTVVPFSSYGGTGWGESLDDLEALCPDSTILEGLAVKRDGGDSLPGKIEKWLGKIGII